MFYSKEAFELRKKTSSDILEDEQKEADEVESSSTLKKDDKSSYKQKNEQFLVDIKEKEKLDEISEIKNRQIQSFAESSAEYYTMPAKHSVLLYVLLGIFLVFLLASVGLVLFFNLSQNKVASYGYDDMKPEFSKGTVFMFDREATLSESSLGKYLFYKNNDGKDVLRKIVSVDNLDDWEISLSTLEEGATPEIFHTDTGTVYGMHTQTFSGGMGIVVFFVANYGYVLVAVFFVLVVTVLIVRGISSRKASNKFMNRMDNARASINKRRKQLSEGVQQMQSGDANNIEVLSDLLNVSNKLPGEERLTKIKKQLKERQVKQVENIKSKPEETQQSAKKKQEDDVINFVRNEIEKQEKNVGLSEEEIAKRLKDAEETNKNI